MKVFNRCIFSHAVMTTSSYYLIPHNCQLPYIFFEGKLVVGIFDTSKNILVLNKTFTNNFRMIIQNITELVLLTNYVLIERIHLLGMFIA